MAANDTVQLSVRGTVHGQTHVHTLHFRYQEVTANEQGLIDAWQSSARTAYRALFQPADNPVELLTARQVCGSVPLRAPVEEVEVAPNIVGTRTGATENVPSWLAAVGSLRTASAGRSRRGRFFIGGLTEDRVAGNNLAAAHITSMQAYVDALIAAFQLTTGTNTSYKLVVHSHKLAAVPGTQCQDSSTPVTGILVRTPLGSMKSRKPGSGT